MNRFGKKKLSEIIAEIENMNGISDYYLHRDYESGNLQLNIEFNNEKSDIILKQNNINEIKCCAFWE